MKTIRFLLISSFLIGLGFSPTLQASQYDIKEMTPEISQAIKNRQARYAELQTLKQNNKVGETNQGYAADLGNASAVSIVAAENRDRKVIYHAIANQNNLGPSGFKTIEKVFAEVQREKASAGESIQLADGTWSTK